jgi:hypothetical protein
VVQVGILYGPTLILLVVSCVEGFRGVLEAGIGLVCLHDFG